MSYFSHLLTNLISGFRRGTTQCAFVLVGLVCLSSWSAVTCANEVALPEEHVKFFESKVRPLLFEHCWGCHGPDKQKGDLRLDSLSQMLLGGESGAAIVPGKPDESLFIEAIRYEGFEMPPTGKLAEQDIATLVRWVAIGAPWPGSDATVARRESREKISAEDRAWWAFQPLHAPTPPELPTNDLSAAQLQAWSQNPIDAFVLRKLIDQGLTPAAPANRTQLLRRIYFDLIGLPPTPEQVDAFLQDQSPQAYERVVDDLLDSSHYGERWARHWLDLVRYADSDGYRIDHYRPTAWRYRDYVIDAFNNDKPYDRFVQEQIAGDEMFPNDPAARIATGYLRHGIYEYNSRDARGQWETILTDITDTTGDVFLGMGMQCARCHDHKFDPILQKDYFRLQAFFAPLLLRDDEIVASDDEREDYARQLAEWEGQTGELRQRIEAIEASYRQRAAAEAIGRFPADLQVIAAKPVKERTPLEHQLYDLMHRQVIFEYDRLDTKLSSADKELVLSLRKELAAFEKLRPRPLATALTVADVGSAAPQTVIPKRSAEGIEPGVLTLLDPEPAQIETNDALPTTGRRTALARWLTRPDNPLTTRVIANRIWQYHFGSGLAPNSSDFGRLGGEPTHPELLDWLASRFVEDGWSFKKLHRLIVTSAAYGQSTEHADFEACQRIDPTNRYYWRGNTRRLEAEQIRDALLAVSGRLNAKAGGPGVLADVPRRTIYTRVMRNARDPLLDVFDLPLFFSSDASRNTTTTPVQSLLLFNSPEMIFLSQAFAERVAKHSSDLTERVAYAWRLVYGRTPLEHEIESSLAFIRAQQEHLSELTESTAVTDLVISRLPYRDGQALAIQPTVGESRLFVDHDARWDICEMTVETFFQVRSIYETGSVRTAVAKWSGKSGKPGWAFGVTGKGSRRKPQTLVMQMWGQRRDGSFGEAAVFSDQHVELDKPYFAAAAVTPAGEQPGRVTFYLKDLSNDDEPLSIVHVEHNIVGGVENREPLTIGGRAGDKAGAFDGLIDDLRISRGVLPDGQLLFTSESVTDDTLAYWQFEAEPGVLRDSSPNQFDFRPPGGRLRHNDPAGAAFVDFCHALLNSNEFLYVP